MRTSPQTDGARCAHRALRRDLATAKARIFELAKEVGLTSKELIALFNDRLGGIFEAKNQLSVVPDQIADLVRSVLAKPAAPAKPAAKAAPKAPVARLPPRHPPLRPPHRCQEGPPNPPLRRVEPVARLKPVTGTTRPPRVQLRAAPEAAVAEPQPAAPEAPAAAAPPAVAPAGRFARAAAGRSTGGSGRRPAPQAGLEAARCARSDFPAPAGPGRPIVDPPPGSAADHHGIGVARTRRPACPAAPASRRAPVPHFPARAAKPRSRRSPGPAARSFKLPATAVRAGNGPFRPMGPGAARPGVPPRPGETTTTSSPSPTSGGRPGDNRFRTHEDKAAAKKDREKEMLLDKERHRGKKKSDHHSGRAGAYARGDRNPRPADGARTRYVDDHSRQGRDHRAHQDGHDGDHQPEHPVATWPRKSPRSSASTRSSKKPAKKSASSKKKTSPR